MIGSRPEAAVFQSGLCFVLHNALQVVRGQVAESNAVCVAEVSSELLFRAMVKELQCWDYLIDRTMTMEWFSERWTAERLRVWLATTLKGRWHSG